MTAEKNGRAAGIVSDYCDGCDYAGWLESTRCCWYLMRVGHCRPCAAGDGCTEKTIKGVRILERSWDTEKAKQLLCEGYSYLATADAVGIKMEQLKSFMSSEQRAGAAWLEDYRIAKERSKQANERRRKAAEAGAPNEPAHEPAVISDARPAGPAVVTPVQLSLQLCGCEVEVYAPYPAAAMRLLERLCGGER